MSFTNTILNSKFATASALAVILACSVVVASPVMAQSGKPAETKAETKPAVKAETKPAAKDTKPQESQESDKVATTAVGIAQAPWAKVCGKAPTAEKETCLTGQEARSEKGEFLTSVAIEELQGEGKKIVRVAVPVGLLIQPGLIVRADDQKGFPARFSVCLPNACFASVEAATDLVAQMKKGKTLLIAGRNMQGKEINISMPLIGFGTAYDGPALDTKALEEQQKKLQEGMQKKAEEERKKLLEKPAEKK